MLRNPQSFVLSAQAFLSFSPSSAVKTGGHHCRIKSAFLLLVLTYHFVFKVITLQKYNKNSFLSREKFMNFFRKFPKIN